LGRLAAVGLLTLTGGAASAQSAAETATPGAWSFGTTVTTYQRSADFIAALKGRPFNLEDYESLPFEFVIPDGTVVNDVQYNYLGDFGIFDGLVGNQYANIGLQGLYYDHDSNGMQNVNDFFYNTWGEKLVVTFPRPVLAVGMHFSVVDSQVLSDYCIVETRLGSATSGGGSELHDPPGSNLFFAGLISNVPFTTATIYCTPEAPSGFNLDNLYWVPVGEACDPCDTNCDGVLDAFDIEPFIGLLVGPGSPCNTCTGDVNGDGAIDAFDIEPFINCLVGP
jgi:hypothetical protein